MATAVASAGLIAAGGPHSPHGNNNKHKMRRQLMDSYKATIKSEPSVHFGTSVRPPLLESGGDSPGPGAYVIKSTMYKNPSSTLRSPPSFSVRGREKFGSPNSRADDPTYRNEPGPGHYKISRRHLAEPQEPEYSFPKDVSHSSSIPKGGVTPGPGHYKVNASVGKQVLSTKRSANGFGFGSGERPELIQVSTADVGPGEYHIAGDCGSQQVESWKRNSNAIRFGKSRRDKGPLNEGVDEVPGPGSYTLPSWHTSGAGNPYKKAPRTYMAGREKFGSPFGW